MRQAEAAHGDVVLIFEGVAWYQSIYPTCKIRNKRQKRMTFISYAQNGEDVILWRALKDVEKGFYIDVGACDPDELSVTKAFYERGWRGINIEPARQYYESCVAKRPRDINLNVAVAARSGIAHFMLISDTGLSTTVDEVAAEAVRKGWPAEAQQVPALSLSDICQTLPTGEIHFLKIDVEGGERAVLEGADFERFRPWIVVIEATAPLSTERNEHLWEELLLRARYQRVFFDGVNLYYVAEEHSELTSNLAAPPNALDDFKPVRLMESENRIAALTADLAAKQAETQAALEGMRQQHDALRAQLESSRIQLEEATGQAEAQQALIARLEKMVNAARGELVQASRRITELEQQAKLNARLKGKLDQQVEEISLLQTRYQILASENARLQRHRDEILSSTSWRVSAPLRKVKTALRVARHEPRRFMPLVVGNFRRRAPNSVSKPTLASELVGNPSPEAPPLPLPQQDAQPGTPEFEALDGRSQIAALIRRDITQRRLAC